MVGLSPARGQARDRPYLPVCSGGRAISLSLPLGVQAIIKLQISGGQVATSWGVLIAFVTIGVGFTGALQVMQLALAENIQQRLFDDYWSSRT